VQLLHHTYTTVKEFHIKKGDKILSLIKRFSATEKVVFGILIIIALVTALSMANRVNKYFMVLKPTHGGSLTEGVIGLPRSINPVLAFTDVDKDMSTLIYSGLMKYEDGEIVGDLAEKYTISDDGLIYDFTLRNDIRFHDGLPLTTDDVEFTIQKIQDGVLKSPRKGDWRDVVIKKINEREIQFILKQPYSPFLANTTVGILPKHIWKNVDADQFIFSQYNIEPIGSGPYKLDNIKRDSGGIPQSYSLSPFNRFYGKKPYISSLNINFFSNEKLAIDALNSGNIESLAGVSPQEISKVSTTSPDIKVLTSPLPRLFGIFLNQNNAPVLANKEVRQALDLAVDKQKIVKQVLLGYGITIDSPLPIGVLHGTSTNTITSDQEKAKSILTKAGWLINKDGILEKKDKKSSQILEFSISTADSPELKQAAELAKADWESIGVKVDVKVFEYGDLAQNIIKTRKYDALLFGEFIGKDLDLYAFWHSSQRNSPGLNISMYVNSKVDKILEDARTTSDDAVRESKYYAFQKIIQDETPAIFLYSPEYTYVIPTKIQGVDFKEITNSSDRWHNINEWYIETDKVWKVFAK
jgi:peptide/nickel transport system substrate-binding protein